MHDAGQVVHLLTEKISALRVENEELRSGMGPKVVVATKKRVVELGAVVDRLKAALGDSEQHCKDLELATDIICGELKEIQDSRHRLEDEVLKLAQDVEVLRSELQSTGTKAIANYKESHGFQSGLEKMGQVTYEFGYQVA
ncbi:hypothetical protein B296_00019680 [Ensete ventricosum]|uniref:Uncharacterized protein n=1 Tax=Ensete ventricosum TaxID=4639 RepID=A0A427A552_ENSVE|nr:hypothetical protein B296_00019680 [Ensete ventricosum]